MTTTRYQEKIIVLWIVFLLGTLFHVDLGLMPLFHGIDIANETSARVGLILWLMLCFFVLPMFVIIATVWTDAVSYRLFHWVLTLVYSVLNFLHLALDLTVQPIVWSQITLMVILFLIGLVLNGVSYRWWRAGSNRYPTAKLKL